MRLADDEFKLDLGTRSFTLRPTLRAAFALNLKHDGFQSLSRSIAEGSFSACDDLISASCTNDRLWTDYTVMGDMKAVREVLAARDQLLEFVLILAGANSKSDEPAKAGKPISFEEYHTKLFQIGTGWLLWTPEATWNATSAEIINAHIGRRAMLTAVYGGKRDDEETIEAQGGKLDAKARAELNALGDLNVVSMRDVR
jgi:hypothetical protein